MVEKLQLDLTKSLLLAVSSGIDSVFMVDMCHRAGCNFGIAHCNFGLRGEESDGDEAFVKNLAETYGVPFYTKRFDTVVYALTHQVSTQMAARNLRYEWFEAIREAEGYEYIATAHHQNDALETLLLNLCKGTGLAGLHGIKPQNGYIIRPILFATKKMIEDYATQNQLFYREDSSNASNKYQRNLLRNEVIPLLKKINPNLEDTIGLTIEKIRAVEDVFGEFIEQIQRELCTQREQVFSVSFATLKKQKMSTVVLILSEILKPYGFNYAQCKAIAQSIYGGLSGKVFWSATHRLLREQNQLSVVSREVEYLGSQFFENLEELANIFEVERIISSSCILKNPSLALLDFYKIRFPLQVRTWQPGDWFCPMGMGGKRKKVSDFLIDNKIPMHQKEGTRVLVDALGNIVWLIGMRPDERFRGETLLLKT